MPPLDVTISSYFTIEPAATTFARARFFSTMWGFGLATGAAGVTAGVSGATGGAPGGVTTGGTTGGATGTRGRRRRRAGAGHTSVTVGIEPPLQVAPTVSVPKMGQVCVIAVCAGTGNCWVTPFTVSVETLSRPKFAL